jgi:thiamine-phosphate pyrophosphorylase
VLRLPALYAIVDPLDTGRDRVTLAETMLAGGARLVQLRCKEATPRELLALAARIAPLARRAGALFLVNDRPDIARAVEADGVHLGQDDLPLAAARRVLGPDRVVGVSTHEVDEARAAASAGADYVAVGPIYDTASKVGALAPRGLALVHAVRAAVRCPLVAIGGITPSTAPAVLAAGADAVAMIGALVRAEDPAAAVREALAAVRPSGHSLRSVP